MPHPIPPTSRVPPPHVRLVGCGEALGVWGIRRTPEGGAGRVESLSRILQIFNLPGGLPLKPHLSQKSSNKSHFLTSLLALIFPSEAEKSLRNALQRICSWGSKSVKIAEKSHSDTTLKHYRKNIMQIMQKWRHRTFKNMCFAWEGFHFCTFAAFAKNTQNGFQMDVKMT